MLANSILGLWIFTSLIYQGEPMPLPNPSLKIQYQFEDTGMNTLRYHREGEQGFCERRALYEFSEGKLVQQVVWVNPQNAFSCHQDMDMRLGYQSWSKAWLKDGKFYLAVQMGEENLIYVWEKN
ncbi:MAG: hypothetical protein OM95_09585 [Bdellovibrio sp. ArHS]|uniref:hypothetical protein n=1 Tax=Bdellovibrio sp. ArHS TaxID=1569284 RepID=UPI000583A316|nr:hypothetical protein [Bdellovibrio sp. ArHS]KHD88377.1 MAG: hypothetical protein OM95_09585 [Bdellovibrio sp. ArHS]